MLIDVLSTDDLEFIAQKYNTYSPRKKNSFINQISTNNEIYREYEKVNCENPTFIATDKYYISDINDETNETEYIGFNFSKSYSYKGGKCIKNIYLPFQHNFFEIITKCAGDNLFVSRSAQRTININSQIIDLVVINNISFTLEETEINKHDILNKIIYNDQYIDNKLLEKLYYNKEFADSMNLNLPIKYLDNNNIQNKFLFKIDFTESYVYKKNILYNI